MKKRITLIENSLNEDSEMIVWEFLKLSEQFTWKFHEDKSCFKAHKKWKHIEWSQSLKNNVKDIYNNPQYITEDEKNLIDFHKHFAIQINNIENEIIIPCDRINIPRAVEIIKNKEVRANYIKKGEECAKLFLLYVSKEQCSKN